MSESPRRDDASEALRDGSAAADDARGLNGDSSCVCPDDSVLDDSAIAGAQTGSGADRTGAGRDAADGSGRGDPGSAADAASPNQMFGFDASSQGQSMGGAFGAARGQGGPLGSDRSMEGLAADAMSGEFAADAVAPSANATGALGFTGEGSGALAAPGSIGNAITGPNAAGAESASGSGFAVTGGGVASHAGVAAQLAGDLGTAGAGTAAASNAFGSSAPGKDAHDPSLNARMRAGSPSDAAQDALSATLGELERVLGGSSDARSGTLQAASGSTGRSIGDAVAARLSEVEGKIARERVAQAMSSSGAEVGNQAEGGQAANGASLAAQSGIGSGMAHSAAAASQFAMASRPDAQAQFGMDGALSGNSAGIAPDLASGAAGLDGETPAAARIAAKGAQILANQRGGAITMRLEPPALGQLRIELRLSHGTVAADFTAATPEARVLLEANLGMLRERLESQGLSVDRMTVHGGGRGSESVAQASQQSGDARGDADGRDRSGDRQSGTRQDAAGGESRGRRDGEASRDGSQGNGREGRGQASWQRASDRDFARVFGASLESRTGMGGRERGVGAAEPSRRAG